MASTDSFDPYREWLGIGAHEHPVDHYRLLGINQFEADVRVISNAADQRMIYIRTFQSGRRSRVSQEILNELSVARLCLLNPEKKERYDDQLRQTKAAVETIPTAIPVAPPEPPVATPTESLEVSTPPAPSISTTGKTRLAATVYAKNDGSFLSSGWLPIVAVMGAVVVAGLVWAIGRSLSDPSSLSEAKGKPGGGSSQSAPVDSPSAAPVPKARNGSSPQKEAAAASDRVTVYQEGNGSVNFSASVAKIHGSTPRTVFDDGNAVIQDWSSTDDWLDWSFAVIKPGDFQVEVTYELDRDSLGGTYELAIGEQSKQVQIDPAGDESAGKLLTDQIPLTVDRSGHHRLVVRAKEIAGDRFIVLHSIRMIPLE